MKTTHSRQSEIEKTLDKLLQDGAFVGAVVANEQGLPIATSGQADTELIAAVAASMKQLAERPHQQLTEITTMDNQGHKIVSRFFSIGEDLIILAVEIPSNRTYRRLMASAIKEIKLVWSGS
ncbi:MAG: roadblock/LC7 domain-containing protein [Chloroflexota bacterium]